MVNVVVVAGGKQTRFKSLSVFPKVLLPTASSCSILKELIDRTRECKTQLKRWIVVNTQQAAMLKTYVEVNGLSDVIEVVESENTNGSFNTLREVKHLLPTDNVLFIWSDLAVSDFTGIIRKCEACKEDISGIIFTNTGHYRYGASGYSLDDPRTRLVDNIYYSSSYEGNIPGLYYLKDLSIFDRVHFSDGEVKDLVDAISLEDLRLELCDLKDIGVDLFEYRDLGIYKKRIKDEFKEDMHQTRFFNSLSVNEDGKTITKRVVDKNYAHLIKKEIEWYSQYKLFTSEKNLNAVPTIYSSGDDFFVMDYLAGYKPLHEILDRLESQSDLCRIKALYKNVFSTVDKVSSASSITVSFDTFIGDLKKEVVDKVIDRCERIKDFLLNYDRNHLESVLSKVYRELILFSKSSEDFNGDLNTMKYWFCHGDLNGSNVMVDEKSLEVKFIDPRGYFGNTKMYGWKPYELAKILYCLYGYDDFNIKPQIYLEDWPKPRMSLEFSGFNDMVFDSEANYKYYQLLVGVIYVALAGYISQDIMKSNIAYDYGMRLLEWTLEKC